MLLHKIKTGWRNCEQRVLIAKKFLGVFERKWEYIHWAWTKHARLMFLVLFSLNTHLESEFSNDTTGFFHLCCIENSGELRTTNQPKKQKHIWKNKPWGTAHAKKSHPWVHVCLVGRINMLKLEPLSLAPGRAFFKGTEICGEKCTDEGWALPC